MLAFLGRASAGAVLLCFSVAAFAAHGRTAGVFNVSGGSATYAVPIWTPPGPNGLQPSISLTYDSHAGNGTAGVGWGVTGLSSITRCTRTLHQDGAPRRVDFTSGDRYCIDGNRLRLASGSYGVASSVYHTEIADYSRITAFGTVGSGPEYFIVEAKNGLKLEYGRNLGSRFATTAGVLEWKLNKVIDRSNNSYTIAYSSVSGGALRPGSIFWTPTSHGASTYLYEIRFNYDADRVDIDSSIGAVGGFLMVDRGRIGNIEVRSNGAVVRRYKLTYGSSTHTSRSLLTSLKECADEAETNCLAETLFTYQQPTGVGLSAGAGTPPAGSSANLVKGRYDFNGDGKDDLAYRSGTTWWVAFGADIGFAGPYNTGITALGAPIGRFLPNGRFAFATLVSNSIWVYRWNDATASFVGHNTGVSATVLGVPIDYNGDGLADLVNQHSSNQYLQVRPNTSTGSGNPSFSSTLTTTATLSASWRYGGTYPYSGNGLSHNDINGDGREDLNMLMVWTGGDPPGGGPAIASATLPGTSTGFQLPPTGEWITDGTSDWPSLHFNGDPCTDRMVGNAIHIAACNDSWGGMVTAPAAPLQLLDWDGDGKTDILFDNGGTLGVYRSTGNGFAASIATSIPSSGSFFSADVDGDGLDDLIKLNGTSAISYWAHGYSPSNAANVPDLLASVTDGFGVASSVLYASISSSIHNAGAATDYPLQVSGPSIVPIKTTHTAGDSTTYDLEYRYAGSRVHATRRSGVGFQRIDVTDARNGTDKKLISRTYFEQQFPIAGMVSQRELMQGDGTTTISRETVGNTFVTLDTTALNQRYFVFPWNRNGWEYEVGGTWNGNLLKSSTTTYVYDHASGTPYDTVSTVSEPASGANGLSAGTSWTSRTYAPLAYLVNDTSTWCLGRPGQTQIINSHNATYGDAISRTTSATWNTSYCRPTQTVEEPGDPELQVTIDLDYDAFGNLTWSRVTGIGMTPRVTQSVYSNSSYTTGQFPLSITNALSQTSTLAWNYTLGVPTSAADANGLTTSWQYDAFARRAREDRPDSTFSTWSWSGCSGCDSRVKTLLIQNFYGNGVGLQYSQLRFLDQFDRSLYEYEPRADNYSNVTSRDFDSLGRVIREYFPYVNNGIPIGYTSIAYDRLNRVTSVSRPISESNPALQTTTLSYEGLTQRVTDAQGKQSTKVLNSAGQLFRSSDHAGYFQSFHYDAFGNSKLVLDTYATQLQASNYNRRGMLKQRTDMDMGTWTFTPNALGEVVSQTDAKNQTTTFAFDLLGRLTSREEAEGTSYFIFGNSSSLHNIGSLQSMSGPGYSEAYTYDSLGRPSRTTISADQSYQIDYEYNEIGALKALTYPTSTSSFRLKLKYEYQHGNLKRILDFNDSQNIFWTATAVNARGQVTQELAGNSLISGRQYDAVNGLLSSIQSGPSGGNSVQWLEYEWDLIGNLKRRRDRNQSNLTEEFFYDDLYRLQSSTLNGTTNLSLSYDALDNILTKSDVGSYSYDPTKKHQLLAAGGYNGFQYDNNGNQKLGRYGPVTWSSYNYPLTIGDPGPGYMSSTFSYAPDRKYWKQVSRHSSGAEDTTYYIGGILEKVYNTAGTDWRHMIRAGGATIVVSRQANGANNVFYVLSDHLGSNTTFTGGSLSQPLHASYDAFGRRRDSDWSGGVTPTDLSSIAGITRRGYTGHTMLDSLELIHMNGRVQDPLLGRFLSADPFITEPLNTQNYNRYSYVYNNPLTYLDPSGFKGSRGKRDTASFPPPSFGGDCNVIRGSCQSLIISAGPCFSYVCYHFSHLVGMATAIADTEYAKRADSITATVLPQIAIWQDRGVPGTWRDATSGFTKNMANTVSEMLRASNPVLQLMPNAELPISDRERGGAALSEGIGVVASVSRTVGPRVAAGIERAFARNLLSRVCCFAAGTLVYTEHGMRPIEEIQVGDRVWARDEKSGEMALKPVERLIQKHEREIWVVELEIEENGSTAVEKIKTTDDHPWADATGGWLATKELQAGSLIVRATGRPARVASVTNAQQTQPTYNFEVADFHTYFVGDAKFWVHNANEDCFSGLIEAARATTRVKPTLQTPERIIVDSRGNAIPLKPGETLTRSPDGKWVQVRDAAGNPTGMRIDGPHNPRTHPDPRAQQPHSHVPGVTNPDGTPWLPVN